MRNNLYQATVDRSEKRQWIFLCGMLGLVVALSLMATGALLLAKFVADPIIQNREIQIPYNPGGFK